MNKKQFFLLVIISALWGSSFIFMRVLSPIFGPILTASFRLIIGSLFLYIYFIYTKRKVEWKRDFKWLLIVGVLNSAVPFTLFGFAALYIPASLSVILNSTSPMFGMIFGFMILNDKFSVIKVIGLLCGTMGVVVLSNIFSNESESIMILSILACVLASAFYGLSGAIIKKYAYDIDSKELTLGSMLIAGIILLPIGLFTSSIGVVTINTVILLIVFGVFCTTVTYLIYFDLIKQIGPVKALMTTYLMPVFGILWGVLFLKEEVSVNLGIGLVIIFMGIYLVTYRKKTT